MRIRPIGALVATVFALSSATSRTLAAVDLVLKPSPAVVAEGDLLEVGLYAISDNAETDLISAVDVVLTWDPAELELSGFVNNGPYPWLLSGFHNDELADGLNDSLLDGDALYQAVGQFNVPADTAGPDGLLVTTFRFTALGRDAATQVAMVPELGEFSFTRVFKFNAPNVEVTGSLEGAQITVTPVRLWAADVSVLAGRTAEIVVGGEITGQEAIGVTILVALVPQPGSSGAVVFTPAPPVDIEQRGDPWPLSGVFTPFDTNAMAFSETLNGSVDDDGSLLGTPATYIGPLSSFPVMTADDAEGSWAIRLCVDPCEEIEQGSFWSGAPLALPTALRHGTLKIVGFGDGDGGGTIDMRDYNEFQACFTDFGGPADPPLYSLAPEDRCGVYDFDGDGAIDASDYEEFQRTMTGP